MANRTIFGGAGNPPNFWKSEYSKNRVNAPEWLRGIGLDALEIQCGYGVRMSDDQAEAFRLNSDRFHITLSIHAPYYISLGNNDRNKSENSLNEIRKSVELAHKIGSNRVIFHLGSIHGDREKARKHAIESLLFFENNVDLKGVKLYPEIAGKENQLGSLDDVLSICESVTNAIPCIDLAHLYARTQGSLITIKDYGKVIDEIQTRVGFKAIENLHIHLYPVEWGDKGEVRHKAFFDKVERTQQLPLFSSATEDKEVYYPRYEPFLDLIIERNINPIIICEAKDSQDLGALDMKNYYDSKSNTMLPSQAH